MILPITFHLDLLPTLAEFCQVEIPSEVAQKLDGRSLVPLLAGNQKTPWPERIFFTDTYNAERPGNIRAAVRTDRYRATIQRGSWQLYDMHTDPGQTVDIADNNPAIVNRLAKAFEDWRRTIDLESLAEVTIPVGHPSRSRFVLPANEAQLVSTNGKGIRYTGDNNSGYANSWITDWTSTDAFPIWTIDVLESGTYSVSLEFTCRAENSGCELEVLIGSQHKSVTISKSFDPPLLDKPDRIDSENYQDKAAWAEYSFGEFKLDTGIQQVSIRLKSLSGGQGIDLKSVLLTRRTKTGP